MMKIQEISKGKIVLYFFSEKKKKLKHERRYKQSYHQLLREYRVTPE